MVRRDVVRLVTPGTLTEDTLLDARRNNYLAGDRARAASASAATAASRSPSSIFRPASSASPNATAAGSPAELARLEPGEIIVSDALYGDAELAPLLRALPAVTPLGARRVRRRHRRAPARLLFRGGDHAMPSALLSRLELTAAAACITYVERTQIGKRPPLSPPMREAAGATLAIDAATRANLELMRTLSRRAARLARSDAIDRTVTAAGSRLLAQRLAAPLTDPAAIATPARCGRAASSADAALRGDVREQLAAAPDLARALARLVVGRGGPRDLAAIRDGLARRGAAAPRGSATAAARPAEIADAMAALQRARSRASPAELAAALADELPLFKRDGGFVAPRYDAALDETRALRDESRRVVAALQARYAEETQVRVAQDPPQQRARLFRRGHRAARRQAR